MTASSSPATCPVRRTRRSTSASATRATPAPRPHGDAVGRGLLRDEREREPRGRVLAVREQRRGHPAELLRRRARAAAAARRHLPGQRRHRQRQRARPAADAARRLPRDRHRARSAASTTWSSRTRSRAARATASCSSPPSTGRTTWISSGNRITNNGVSGSGMADLALAAGSGAGNCFEDNTAAILDPPDLAAACSVAGAGSAAVAAELMRPPRSCSRACRRRRRTRTCPSRPAGDDAERAAARGVGRRDDRDRDDHRLRRRDRLCLRRAAASILDPKDHGNSRSGMPAPASSSSASSG